MLHIETLAEDAFRMAARLYDLSDPEQREMGMGMVASAYVDLPIKDQLALLATATEDELRYTSFLEARHIGDAVEVVLRSIVRNRVRDKRRQCSDFTKVGPPRFSPRQTTTQIWLGENSRLIVIPDADLREFNNIRWVNEGFALRRPEVVFSGVKVKADPRNVMELAYGYCDCLKTYRISTIYDNFKEVRTALSVAVEKGIISFYDESNLPALS